MHDPVPDEPLGMVLVMGVTGSGKSYFINKLSEGSVKEGPGLESGMHYVQNFVGILRLTRKETQRPQIVTAILEDESGYDTEIAIVDTPGFDDSKRSDADILAEISQFLTAQYIWGEFELRGIIYLHRITDPKMTGSAGRYFRMFQDLCGEEAFKNVILVTTMWDQLKDESVGYRRDQELRNNFWNLMEEKGSQITTFDGSHEQAEGLVLQLLGKPPITLQLQRELVDDDQVLENTSAGRLVAAHLDATIRDSERQLNRIGHPSFTGRGQGNEAHWSRRRQAEAEVHSHRQKRGKLKTRVGRETKRKADAIAKPPKERTTGKEKISLFASFLGLTVNLVFAILPLAGAY